MTDRIRAWLGAAMLAERDAAGIAAFRVVFGLLGLVSAIRFLAYGWVEDFFVRPRFFFTYSFAPFVEPLGASGMRAVFWIVAISSTLVALGLFYRAALIVFFVAFSYIQLIDVTNYLNHYYLVSLLALLMAFMPLGQAYGLDGLFRRRTRSTVPGWCYALLRFQVGVVYTYAGVAKLTEDWLYYAQPLDIWLASRTSLPVVGPLLAHPWAPHLMSWAGCAFDLTIVAWLLWRRTRPFAFAAVLVFHALTRHLFPIGMFPFIMVAGATAFFDPTWPRRLLRRPALEVERVAPAPSRRLRAASLVFALYAVVQIAVPLRAFFYGGNVHWHEQGMRFSWRVMVREKNASVTYLVEDIETGRVLEVSPRRYLDARQQREFGTQPDLIVQLAHHIAKQRQAETGRPVRVRAEVLVSLNGRRSALLIDPSIDLTAVEVGLAKAPFILPAPPGEPPFLHRGATVATGSLAAGR
jgi:vitamin K-dependent gamma-carboxylase